MVYSFREISGDEPDEDGEMPKARGIKALMTCSTKVFANLLPHLAEEGFPLNEAWSIAAFDENASRHLPALRAVFPEGARSVSWGTSPLESAFSGRNIQAAEFILNLIGDDYPRAVDGTSLPAKFLASCVDVRGIGRRSSRFVVWMLEKGFFQAGTPADRARVAVASFDLLAASNRMPDNAETAAQRQLALDCARTALRGADAGILRALSPGSTGAVNRYAERFVSAPDVWDSHEIKRGAADLKTIDDESFVSVARAGFSSGELGANLLKELFGERETVEAADELDENGYGLIAVLSMPGREKEKLSLIERACSSGARREIPGERVPASVALLRMCRTLRGDVPISKIENIVQLSLLALPGKPSETERESVLRCMTAEAAHVARSAERGAARGSSIAGNEHAIFERTLSFVETLGLISPSDVARLSEWTLSSLKNPNLASAAREAAEVWLATRSPIEAKTRKNRI